MVVEVVAVDANEECPLINLKHVDKVYSLGEQEVWALDDLSLEIYPGEMVAIMGPSGSGKSTLMNMIGCLDIPTRGSYLLDGVEVSTLDEFELAEIRNRKIGFVFQGFNLLARTTALENVELPLLYAGEKNREEKAILALERVGLGDRLDHKSNELSGGQQQRVAIARAIVGSPSLILADEPTGNLSSIQSEEILGIFQKINDEGSTVVMVTHEESIAEHCKRVVTVRDGQVLEDEPVTSRLNASDELIAMQQLAASRRRR
jgi:putative ABC transport system ATP-binding protein